MSDAAAPPPSAPPGRAGLEPALALALFTAGYLVFLRPIWASAGDTVPGADDALLNLYTLEQWYRWMFHGQGGWLGGGFFYPEPNTLGMTDAMFLLSLPFSLLRLAGLDPFTAYQAVLYGAALLSGLAFYFLLRHELRLPALASAAGTVPAAFGNAMFLSVGHTQLFAFAFVPLVAILLLRFVRAAWDGARAASLGYGATLAVLMPLFFLTGFYAAWFLTFFLALAAVVALLAPSGRRAARELARRASVPQLVFLAVLAALALIPFLLAYVPMLRQIGPRPYEHVVQTLPQWFDLVNVSAENLVWRALLGDWLVAINQPDSNIERLKGMTPFALVVFAVAAAVVAGSALGAGKAPGRAPDAPEPWVVRLAACVALAVLLSWLAMLRWDGHSAWYLVYKLVPGGSAIRAVFRYNLLLAFGVGLVIAAGLATVVAALRARAGDPSLAALVLPLAVGAAIAVEQVNVAKTDFLSKARLLRQIAVVPPAPAGCRAFFATVAEPDAHSSDAAGSRANVVAMLVGQARNVPTLNGHSSGAPAGWGLTHVGRPDYLYRVGEWARARGLGEGLCSLELETGRWSPVPMASLSPAKPMAQALQPEDFRFEGRLEQPLAEMRPGERRDVVLRVTNLGSVAWSSESEAQNLKHAVRFAYQWVPEGAPGPGYHNRWQIIGSIAPGKTGLVPMTLVAPPTPGRYTLEIDGVQEWVAFFREHGNPTFRMPVTVR